MCAPAWRVPLDRRLRTPAGRLSNSMHQQPVMGAAVAAALAGRPSANLAFVMLDAAKVPPAMDRSSRHPIELWLVTRPLRGECSTWNPERRCPLENILSDETNAVSCREKQDRRGRLATARHWKLKWPERSQVREPPLGQPARGVSHGPGKQYLLHERPPRNGPRRSSETHRHDDVTGVGRARCVDQTAAIRVRQTDL